MQRRHFLWLAAGAPAALACSDSDSNPPAATSPSAGPSTGGETPAATSTPGAPPPAPTASPAATPTLQEYPVTRGSGPHDVAPAAGGGVWYTGQRNGTLGLLDPASGSVTEVPLGAGSAPHGVIVGPDGAAWVTDGGLDAVVRVDGATHEVRTFPLPGNPRADLNTAAFDGRGRLWFTGQAGYYGSVDPGSGHVEVKRAPRGPGPYGICATPEGEVYYASLAGSHIARIDTATGEAEPVDPPTPRQGARRIWSDSKGVLWVSEWNSGQLSRFDPGDGAWKAWKLPGDRPQPYAVYVDGRDMVWVTDFGANALVRFDPASETSLVLPHGQPGANVRQLLGRPGEVWGAESGLDALVVARG